MTIAASHTPTASLSSGWSALPPEYAIPEHAPSEAEAREYCRRLARSHYENFSVASWFLPSDCVNISSMFMPTAAFRTISATKWATPRRLCNCSMSGKTELDACYAGRPRHPVFVALAETVRKFEIPKHEFSDLLAAFRQDQVVSRYETFDDLLGLLPKFGESGRPSCALCLRIQRRRAPIAFRLHLHRAATRKFLAGRERGFCQGANLSSARRPAALRRERSKRFAHDKIRPRSAK